ncbi:MAG: acyl-CoA thioesterase [Vicinamibacterales bacterium]
MRVRYAETDQMLVVYYANYYVWFEVARTDLLRQAGFTYKDMEADGYVLPVVESHCEYRQPARYDDEIDIEVEGALLSRVRVKFTYVVSRVRDKAHLATGYTIHGSLDRRGRPSRLPDRLAEFLATSR